nr:protein NETWORKED 1D-like [Tanacetum cinerariifolium]
MWRCCNLEYEWAGHVSTFEKRSGNCLHKIQTRARYDGAKAPLRHEVWPPHYETDQGVDSRQQDGIAELQDLQSKVNVIEKAVIKVQMLTVQEKLDADAKLEFAMKRIEEPPSPSTTSPPSAVASTVIDHISAVRRPASPDVDHIVFFKDVVEAAMEEKHGLDARQHPPDDFDLWGEATGGKKKGNLVGLGTRGDPRLMVTSRTSSSSSSSHTHHT